MGIFDSAISPWFATDTLTSPEMRWALAAGFAKSATSALLAETGVIPGGGLAQPAFVPTSNGSASAPSVSVAPGQCVIVTALGAVYVGTHAAAGTVPLDTPLPSSGLSRIDVLCARILDTETDGGGTTNRLRLQTVTGTAAASPAVPSVPAGYLPLFRMTVNNAGAISSISSLRAWTRAPGAPRLVEAGDTRAGSHPGDLRIFATGRVDCWIVGAWVTIVAPSVWTQENVAYTYAGDGATPGGTVNFGTTGSSYVRYKRAGNDLVLSYAARYGGSGINGGVGNITTVLPQGWVTPAGRDQWLPAQIWINDPVSGLMVDFAGMALVQASSNIMRPYFPAGVGAGGLLVGITPHRIATNGGAGTGRPFVQSGYPQGGTIHIAGTVELAG